MVDFVFLKVFSRASFSLEIRNIFSENQFGIEFVKMPIKKRAKLSREDIIEKYDLKAQGLGREQIVRPEEFGLNL